MNTTIIITQILGITFTVLGLSLLLNKKGAVALLEEATKNTAMMWLFGFISLIMGAILITFNNVWSSGLELLITVLGWIALLKGIFILVFPEMFMPLYRSYKKGNMISFSGVVVFILGLILLYAGLM